MKIGTQNNCYLIITYFNLKEEKERFVLYFRSTTTNEIISKQVFYCVSNDYSQIKAKYHEHIKKESLNIVGSTVYIYEESIKTHGYKFPLSMFNKFSQQIDLETKERYGLSYDQTYKSNVEIISRKGKTLTVRQILNSKEYEKNVKEFTKLIGIKKYTLVLFPACLENAYLSEKKHENAIYIYSEAACTVVASFINKNLADYIVIDEANKNRTFEKGDVSLPLNNLDKVILSIVWRAAQEGQTISKIKLFSNSERQRDKFVRKENILDIPLEIHETTEPLYVHVKNTSILTFGFTLVETVVAFAVFAITAGIAASLIISISTNNKRLDVNNKVQTYLSNVHEIYKNNPGEEGVREITAYEGIFDNQIRTYYVDKNLDFETPSDTAYLSGYRIDWKYSVEVHTTEEKATIIQDYEIHRFYIVGIYSGTSTTNLIKLEEFTACI